MKPAIKFLLRTIKEISPPCGKLFAINVTFFCNATEHVNEWWRYLLMGLILGMVYSEALHGATSPATNWKLLK
jgi:hypothetical protein